LIDRAIGARRPLVASGDVPPDALPDVRRLIAVAGTGAATWAVIGFMAARR